MSELIPSIERFCAAFSHCATSLGSVRFVPERRMLDVSMCIPLPNARRRFHEHIVLDDAMVGGAMSLMLFPPEDLHRAQEGWRWIGLNGAENPTWKPDWVVFADRNGDALFADGTSDACAVFGSIQQRNFLVAESLPLFLCALTTAIHVEAVHFQCDTFEEDMSLKPAFIEAVDRAISPWLHGAAAAGFRTFFFE